MSTIRAFNYIKNKHTLHRRKDCMKKFCESLRKHAKNIIDFLKEKNLPLTNEELNSHQDANICYICEKIILKQLSKSTNYQKFGDHCHYIGKYRGAAPTFCNLKFNLLIEIPVVFDNGSNYDYHFIIKELANEFERQFECLGEKQKSARLFPFQ